MSRYNTIRLTVLNCSALEAEQLLAKAEIVARWLKIEPSELLPLGDDEPKDAPSSVSGIIEWMHKLQQAKVPVDPPQPPPQNFTALERWYQVVSANDRARSTNKSYRRTLAEVLGTLRKRVHRMPANVKTVADFGKPGLKPEGVSVVTPAAKLLDAPTVEKLAANDIETIEQLTAFVKDGGDVADLGLDVKTKAEVIYTIADQL